MDVNSYTDKLKDILADDGIVRHDDVVDFIIIISFLKFMQSRHIIDIDCNSFIFEDIFKSYPQIKGVIPLILSMLDDKKDIPSNSCLSRMISCNPSECDIAQSSFLSYVYQSLNIKSRKALGQYFTPEWLVKYIVDNIFEVYSIDEDSLKKYKVLDPACGTGIFIIYYIRKLLSIVKSCDNRQLTCMLSNIYGFDIDKRALYVAALSLYAELKQMGYDIQISALKLVNIDTLKREQYQQDSVYTICGEKIDINKFDLILGNPPYIENRNINKYYDKKYLVDNYKYAVGRFDMYSIFIERAIELLEEHGVIAYIIPDTFLYNNNFILIRKFVLQNFNINLLIKLSDLVFEDVDIGMIIIMIKKSNKCSMDNFILSMDASCSRQGGLIHDASYNIIPQRYFMDNIDNIFDIHLKKDVHDLKMHILNVKTEYIRNICKVVAGIATGNIKDKLIKTNCYQSDCYEKVLEGSDIGRYFYIWNGKYINMNRSVINKDKGEYATYMRNEFIYNPKILIRQTADRIIAAFDRHQYALVNTLYSLLVVDHRYYIKYILALLNSKLLTFFYRSLIRETGKLFPQLKIYHIQNCPIVYSDKSVQQQICELVTQIEQLAERIVTPSLQDKLQHGCFSQVLENIKKDKVRLVERYLQLNRHIDELIYDIYNLKNDHIKLVENEDIDQGLNNKRVYSYLKHIEYSETERWMTNLCLNIIKNEKNIISEQRLKYLLKQVLKVRFESQYQQVVDTIEQIFDRPLFKDTRKYSWIKYNLARKSKMVRTQYINGDLYFKIADR